MPFVLSLLLAAASAPCELPARKAQLIATVASRDGSTFVEHDEAVRDLKFQRGCVSVVAAYLASSDADERLAGAVYSQIFAVVSTTEWKIPIISEITSFTLINSELRAFALSKPQVEAVIAAAPAESRSIVVAEQLRNVRSSGGLTAALRLLRASRPLVEQSAMLLGAARNLWKDDARRKDLQDYELKHAYQPLMLTVNKPILLGSPRMPAETTVEQTLAAISANKAPVCADYLPIIEAAKTNADVASLMAAASTAKYPTRCDAASLIHWQQPERVLVGLLGVLARLPDGLCNGAAKIAALLSAEAKPQDFLFIAQTVAAGGIDREGAKMLCLWSNADQILVRLGARPDVPELIELAKLLAKERELWRFGDQLVWLLAEKRGDEGVQAILAVVRAEARYDRAINFAQTAEAAIYYAGGPSAEKAATEVRKHKW